VSNPQPGDLVFFGSPAGHVGIYAGNGMMWDSPHTGTAIGLHKIWSSSATYGRP
jgi:cell wall-associated NlpC family hydrolase